MDFINTKTAQFREAVAGFKSKVQSFAKTPEGREWSWYGLCLLGFVCFLILLAILMNVWIMPSYVGLDEVVRVPNVVGKTQMTAFKELEEQGLEPRVRGQYFNADVPAGYVTGQLPYPGSEVKPDRSIYLDVSRGKQMIDMPNLVGLTLRDAKLALLRTSGLEMGRVQYNYNDNLPPDYIFSQSIVVNTKVPVGTQVDVMVSLGAKDVDIIVPDLLGKSLQEAQQLIASLGLTLGAVDKGVSDELNGTLRPGTVIMQRPQKGDSVRSGTPVDITVTRDTGEK